MVSQTLQGAELEYPELEKLILSLIHTARRLQRYFQAHLIRILTDKPIKHILTRPEKSGRIAKWAIELGEHKIKFRGRNSVKGHILADFLAETPSAEDKEMEVEETKSKEPGLENAWNLFIDEASSTDGSGAGLMLVSPEVKELPVGSKPGQGDLRSKASNHKAIPGENKEDIQELQHLFHGACLVQAKSSTSKEHYPRVTPRLLWNACMATVGDPLIHTKKSKAGDDTYNLSMAFLLVGDRHCGVTANSTKRCEIRNTSIIISDNEKQFIEGIFLIFCQRLGILQGFTSVYHPQANGQVEVTNRDIVKGMEQRLGKTHQGWVDELPQVLWAYRTTPKSSNRETPFSLVYGSEAVVPIEISVETKRIQYFDVKQNEKRRREDLDILKERMEIASIRKAYYKQKLEGYYNKRVQPSTFKPGTYVLRLNNASKVEFQGKMGPTWEGPYIVKKAYGDGAYKLEILSGSLINRTWNGSNLFKFYM
ncbi:reverse transcriptase domain-containing protein [Tanacetum coccineum]